MADPPASSSSGGAFQFPSSLLAGETADSDKLQQLSEVGFFYRISYSIYPSTPVFVWMNLLLLIQVPFMLIIMIHLTISSQKNLNYLKFDFCLHENNLVTIFLSPGKRRDFAKQPKRACTFYMLRGSISAL